MEIITASREGTPKEMADALYKSAQAIVQGWMTPDLASDVYISIEMTVKIGQRQEFS